MRLVAVVLLAAPLLACGPQHQEPAVAGNCMRINFVQGMRQNVAYARAVDRIGEHRVIAHYIVSVNRQPYTDSAELDISSDSIAIYEGSCEY